MISQFSPNATHGYSHSDKIFEACRARSIQARNLKYVDRPGQISQVAVREPSLRKSPFLCPFNCKYRVSIAEGIGCGSIAEFFQLSHGKLRNIYLKGLTASVLNWQPSATDRQQCKFHDEPPGLSRYQRSTDRQSVNQKSEAESELESRLSQSIKID